MFYSWQSLSLFDTWHANVKEMLGIPYPGRNARTGEIDEDAQWTDAYTNPVIVSQTDVRAFVEDEIAVRFPDGLGVPTSPPIAIDDD